MAGSGQVIGIREGALEIVPGSKKGIAPDRPETGLDHRNGPRVSEALVLKTKK